MKKVKNKIYLVGYVDEEGFHRASGSWHGYAPMYNKLGFARLRKEEADDGSHIYEVDFKTMSVIQLE